MILSKKQMLAMVNSYASILNEINERCDWMNAALRGHTKLPPSAVREFSYLQLRMICELIATNCLIAHGDMPIASSLRNDWNPSTIMKRLEEIHSNFYPHPVKDVKVYGDLKGPIHSFTARHKHEALTKAELINLHGLCGGVLHVKSLAKRKKSPPSPIETLSDVQVWCDKIGPLLDAHVIGHLNKPTGIIACGKWWKTGRAYVAFLGPDEAQVT